MVHAPLVFHLCRRESWNTDIIPRLKEPLRSHRFHEVSSVRLRIERTVTDINNQHLTNGLQRLLDIWQKVESFAGNYIEGM
ncbi:hypothetical protein TNCV_46351 [Trichonephila clavipes]|nr:hypothetical protein TNCV_46351 [Trichonephila clavipes]